MHACAELVVGLDAAGRSVAEVMRGEAPLLLRRTAGNPLTVHLLGGAAGPLGGDVLRTRITVAGGAGLRLRSVAATLVQPSPVPAPSSSVTVACVAGTLDVWPEPLVSVAGSDHAVRNLVRIRAGADVRWVDEVVLGRHREPGGAVVVRQRIELDDRPLLVHTVRPTSRVTVSAVHVGPPAGPSATILDPDVRAARYALGPTATAWVGLGTDLETVRRALAGLGLRRS